MSLISTIAKKTLLDLEFDVVLKHIAHYCLTDVAKEKVHALHPSFSQEQIAVIFRETEEYIHSLSGDNPIPSHYFEVIFKELQLLAIENSTLEAASFRKIAALCETTAQLVYFFEKFQEFYMALFEKSNSVVIQPDIVKRIQAVFDRFGEIKDEASPELAVIRREISTTKAKIQTTFSQALSQAVAADYLDEIRESLIDDHRVLAVKAMYRKRVAGTVLGTSKTGSIVFIEPEATWHLTRELTNLLVEEQEEIARILKQLTDDLRIYKPDIEQYQDYLTEIDVLYGKARYARVIGAQVPQLTTERLLVLQQAFHPILLFNNLQKKKPTYPQTIALHPEGRIIVISGPNAGGKSITLKTVGLLQLMVQSGIPVPVKRESSFCFFTKILTDIGDNQSVENHLSTYSYRLKMMRQFLQKCDAETLFLIDEFGSGSDPELGGALAETFLEVFYERQAFGIITTHYTNLKMLANELSFAVNANMQFDQRSLEPMYQLTLGEPGSSFTFEVAQKNGIPYRLINRAKKKIERSKVRFDKTIADLQKERNKLQKTTDKLQTEEEKKKKENKLLEEINSKIKQKLENYQELYDSHQKLIFLGRKITQLSENYAQNKNKKQLVAEFLKVVEIEISKRKTISKAAAKQEKEKQREVEQEVQKAVEQIRVEKKKAKKKANQQAEELRVTLEVGHRVRLKEGKSVGTIEGIEKNKATVNYGLFSASVGLDKLEFVSAK